MTREPAASAQCANCGTGLAGPWCHACGQHAHGNHRSLRHLGVEFVETFTHADSRLWRTLRLLAIRPARLTNDYLAGHRAAQIPPLRLLLVVLFVLFALGLVSTDLGHMTLRDDHGRDMMIVLHQKIAQLSLGTHERVANWLRAHLSRALDNPAEFLSVVGEWAERFALLMLPVAALVMRGLTRRRRGFTLFDHFIFAMHSMSATALVLILFELLSRIGLDAVSSWLLLVPPVHLFAHMSGVYRFGVIGTLLRMMLLAVASSIAILLLLGGLAALGLYTLRG